MLSNLGGNGRKCIEKCNFYIKYFDKIKCYVNQPYLVFFRAETWNTHIFFLWPNLIRAETRSTHILFLPLQKQNFLTIESQCVCVILIMCMQYLFQRANRTPHPHPHAPQTNKKNSLPVRVSVWHTHIQGRQKCSMDFRWTAPPPTPTKKKKTLPHMP